MNQPIPGVRRRGRASASAWSRGSSVVALVLLIQALFVLPAAATHVDPVFVSGNPTCGSLISGPDIFEFKVEPVADGTYTDPVTGFTVTIDVNEGAKTFDWSSSSAVLGVVAKGGPNANFYDYRPDGETSDTGLHAPDTGGGERAGLSHISFCFRLAPSTELSVSPSPGETIIAGTSITLTWSETNDGNFDLTNPSVVVDNGCNTSLVSGDTNSDGVLNVGETWVFECTVAPNASTTYTGIGHGFHNGKDVTWCADTNNPPANTTCDQDERAQTTITVVNPSTNLNVQSTDVGPVEPGTVVTLTWSEENDGDADLDNVALNVIEGGAACTPVFQSGDDNSDGILNQGETWVWTCDVTINSLTTVTAVATGTTIEPDGVIVTWCADPGNPPANTLCDQDEIASITIDVLEVGEGCTPGYWRNHLLDWEGYSPLQQFSSVFENAFPGQTLFQVVTANGGGLNALGRHTVAALLNAAHPDVNYPMTEQEVIDAFNSVFPGSNQDYNELKNQFEGFNEAGCPL